MYTRSHRLFLARMLLALMLFAQGVTASSACDWLESSPYQAVLAASEVAPCHDEGFGGACLTHCLADRQVVQKVVMDVSAMPSAPVLILAVALAPALPAGVITATESAAGASPPRRILLQSFQI